MDSAKAYRAWDETDTVYFASVVVFAASPAKAKVAALRTETFENSEYKDIRVRRFPEMDAHYRGREETDWYDAEDRRALVTLGWSCFEPETWECANCPVKDICKGKAEADDE